VSYSEKNFNCIDNLFTFANRNINHKKHSIMKRLLVIAVSAAFVLVGCSQQKRRWRMMKTPLV
ncbi:MAG: hypothetical protein IIU04_00380, partial [Bacteroidales bacterium]|nr:hypothetical protein [Bacteroidales bacterium]